MVRFGNTLSQDGDSGLLDLRFFQFRWLQNQMSRQMSADARANMSSTSPRGCYQIVTQDTFIGQLPKTAEAATLYFVAASVQ